MFMSTQTLLVMCSKFVSHVQSASEDGPVYKKKEGMRLLPAMNEAKGMNLFQMA